MNNNETNPLREEITHNLKTWPIYFKEVVSGKKRFELRKNDRDYEVGDILNLQEWSSIHGYHGNEFKARVDYIFHNQDHHLSPLQNGVICMSISPIQQSQSFPEPAKSLEDCKEEVARQYRYASWKDIRFMFEEEKIIDDLVSMCASQQPSQPEKEPELKDIVNAYNEKLFSDYKKAITPDNQQPSQPERGEQEELWDIAEIAQDCFHFNKSRVGKDERFSYAKKMDKKLFEESKDKWQFDALEFMRRLKQQGYTLTKK